MQFSVFVFVLIVMLPSMIDSVVLRVMRVPLRLSFTQPNLPLQLFFLGVVLPIPAYLLAFAVTRLSWDINAWRPFWYMIGLEAAPPRALLESVMAKWATFLSSYYAFCAFSAFVIGLLFHWSDKATKIFEFLSVIDEDKYAKLQSNKVIIEIDLLTTDGEFVYSGRLGSGISDIYFAHGAIVLKDVLKMPATEAGLSIEEYKGKLASEGKLSSESFLKQMIFPKNNVSNVNVRIGPKNSPSNVHFG